MSVIKIPSSKIYGDISKTNRNNLIQSLSIGYNNATVKFENILGSPYSITLNQVDANGNITFVGNDPNVNDIPFKITSSGDNYFAVSEESPTTFSINKKLYYYSSTSETHYHTMEIAQVVYDSSSNKNYTYYYYSNVSLSYDVIQNTIKITYLSIPLRSSLTTLSVTIAILGNAITSKNQTRIASQKGEPFSVGGDNEVLQSANEYNAPPELRYIDRLNAKVLEMYKNGKQIAKIKCSVSDYLDVDGNLVISPSNSIYPAVFEKYDIVEPYMFTSKGEKPLIINADGTAKRFEVIGVDFNYKGVVWQELTLQEYIE